MKAITINGLAKKYSKIPRVWKRKDTPNQITHGYNTLADSEHYYDGWRDYVEPVYDPIEEQLGAIYFDEANDYYTRHIILLEQENVDENNESKEEVEAESKMREHIEKGRKLHERAYKKIWRRRHKDSDAANKLTQGQARKLMEWFQPTYEFLLTGNWHQARKEIKKNALGNLISAENVVGMTNTHTWLTEQIENYFNNKYDL